MFDLTEADVKEVYRQLKDRYDLVLTNTLSVDDGFEMDCPILVGRAGDRVLWLYEYGGEFVLDVLNAEVTAGTHWHPQTVEMAVKDVAAFMEGRQDYPLIPFACPTDR